MLPSRNVPHETREAYRLDRFASYLAGAYQGAIFPFAGVIAREQLHADALVLSLMTAAPFIGHLGALFWARTMEGRPKLPFVTRSQLTARWICLLMLFASTPLSFALILGMVQVVGSIAMPAYAAVLKEIYPDSERGRIMSYTRAALFSASVLVTFAVGPLLEVVSYRYVFPVGALFGIGAALIFRRIPMPSETGTRTPGGRGSRRAGLPEMDPAESAPSPSATPFADTVGLTGDAQRKRPTWRSSIAETFRYLVGTLGILREDRRFRWFALSVFTFGFGNLIVAPVIPLVQVDQLHISTRHIALLANLAQLTTALSYFFWGRYVDRRGPLPVVVINIMLSALIPVCYFFADSVWMIAPAFVLSGITQAGIDLSYFNGILSFSNAENASRYQALHSFMLGIRGLTAPFIGGGLSQLLTARGLDLRYVFLVALAFILIGCWMQLAGLRRSPRPRPGVPAVAS